jgi:hypothetical protein
VTTNRSGWKVFLAALLATVAGQALAASRGVVDRANFFSNTAIEKADRQINDIARSTGKDLLVEAVPSIPADQQRDYKDLGKQAFFSRWAGARAQTAGVRGIYILLCKEPGHLQIKPDRQMLRGPFTQDDAQQLQRQMLPQLKAKQYDAALQGAVDFVAARLRAQAAPAAVPQGRAAPAQRGGGPAIGAGIGGWICLGIAVFLGFLLLRAVMRGFSRGGMGGGGMGSPGGMGGGMGGGYGGGYGGGGFFQSMLGGIFGAAAGNWLYDSFRGSNAGASQNYGGGMGSPSADDSGTGDFSGGGGAGGDFDGGDSGGGDAGGDFGGGGGDFGGGGGDFGGGADFGGGGGDSGGDF